MKEIVIISGKGGTGKTSVTAAFAALADNAVLVDCDVDAADLHLVLAPEVLETHDFIAGHEARIRPEACQACGHCAEVCRFDAVQRNADGVYVIDPIACEGCGVCAHLCPHEAIAFEDAHCGEWYRSRTRFGPLVHARLGIAAENSGKLVSLIRREARTIAEVSGADLILVDGPPGIGCPVISSIAGADEVVIVTEPTVSGAHDLERVARLAAHFNVPVSLIINKADLHEGTAVQMVHTALARNIAVLGRLPYDPVVTQAQLAGCTIIEHSDGPMSQALRTIWARLLARLHAEPASRTH
jgi:MinD superfamily P-loop ATPase